MIPTKIVVIGAGSASFGLNTLGAILRSEKLHGSQLALVDMNADTLALVRRLADRLNREWNSQMKISSHTSHEDALEGAEFVVSAIEVPPRERLWKKDWEIPLKYGVRQPYAENGGPGGFAHAARNIGPVLKIVHAMEQACPEAWYINFTNPMVRICDAIHRYSRIKVVGLCHQIYAGYGIVGYLLHKKLGIQVPEKPINSHADPGYWEEFHKVVIQATELLDIKAAGTNHFTWMLDVRDRRTGEDLYPYVRAEFPRADPRFEPLTRRVFEAFGWMPIPGDGHLDEYLPWCSDPQTRPWEKYNLMLYDWEGAEKERGEGHEQIRQMGEGTKGIEQLKEDRSEGAVEVIESVAGAGNAYHLAVNLPNQGQIPNLPRGAIVETPGILSGAGIKPLEVGEMPEPVAELLRRELAVVKLCVDSAANGDRAAALQCLLLDPVITDLDVARLVLEDYLTTYKQYLPQYWD